MKIPEAAFDEGINYTLDKQPTLFSTGLRYDGISARRKPIIRTGANTLFNLIRRM